MREVEAQAARELGQWTQKLEVTGTFNLVERLNAGRQRVANAEAKEKVQPISGKGIGLIRIDTAKGLGMKWRIVTENRPGPEDWPVTVVRSR